MKKSLLTLFIVSCTAVTVQAQQGIHFGFHGQMNSIWILNQNNYEFSEMDYEYKFGPQAGLSLGYNWDDNLGVQVEFNYAQMGQDYSDIMKDFGPTEDPSKPDLTTKVLTFRYVDLTYLQVPVLLKYMEGDTKDAIKYQLLGGLQFGYLLGAEQLYTADVTNTDPDEQVNVPESVGPQSGVPDFNGAGSSVTMEDYFQKFDIGLLLDVGADIYVNDKLYFSPSFRGYYGFFDINAPETRNLQPAQGENVYRWSHNAFVGFSLGINFMFPDASLGGGGGKSND